MVAQLNGPDPLQLAGFLGCLFFLVAGVNQLMRLLDRMKEKPPPAETYMTKTGCKELHSRTDQELQHLRVEVDTLKGAKLDARELVNESIDKLRTEMHDSLRRVHIRIDDLPGAVVALLKNTGALK